MKLRILLADGHHQYRMALGSLLSRQSDLDVVGEVGDGAEAVQATSVPSEFQPSLVIMDVHMPGMDGIEATRRIHSRAPHIKVLALSAHDDAALVHAMLAAGAVGYALKGDSLEELLSAIRLVAAGRAFFSSGVQPPDQWSEPE